MIAQLGTKVGGDRLRNLDRCKLDAVLAERVTRERRIGDGAYACPVEKRLDFPVALHAVRKTDPARALARAEYRSHQRKDARGLDQQPGRTLRQVLLVQFSQFSVEVVVHQRDGQVGRALHHAHPELTERSGKLLRAFHVNRLKAYATPLQVFLRSLGREAEARPIGGGRRIRGRAALRHDVAPVEQPLQGFVDLVGGKFLFQIANDLSKAPSGRYGVRQRAVELAAKKELPVLGIEAHGIWRQHIDGEILRKLRNVFAVELWEAVIPIACLRRRHGDPDV